MNAYSRQLFVFAPATQLFFCHAKPELLVQLRPWVRSRSRRMEVQGSFFLIFDTRAFEQLRRRQTREFSFSVLELLVSVCVCVCLHNNNKHFFFQSTTPLQAVSGVRLERQSEPRRSRLGVSKELVKRISKNPPPSRENTRASKQEAARKKVTARHLQHKRRGTKLCQQCR